MKAGATFQAGALSAALPVVAVVDYGAGNLVSIEHALTVVGARVRVARSADDLGGADLLVVPGVGAAGAAMRRLRRTRLLEPVLGWIAQAKPYLGICLGMQLLYEWSEEDDTATFGIITGRTTLLRGAPTLPHTGWNQVRRRRPHPAFDGLRSDADVYFVHSYAGQPEGDDAQAWILGETTHGEPFVSAVARHNVLGVQFHPERSGDAGLRLLGNVVRWVVADHLERPAAVPVAAAKGGS